MRRRYYLDPFNYCPICGSAGHGRGCKPSVYRSIDSANTRAANNDDSVTDATWYPPQRSLTERLSDGFQMMSEDELPDRYCE